MSEEVPIPIRFWDASAKINQTMRILAVLPDRLQERLVSAFISQWSRVKAADLPEGELREDFERLDAELTRGPVTQEDYNAGRTGLIQATVLRMSDDEARDLAERIATFAYSVRKYGEHHRYDREFRAQLNEELLSVIDASDTEQ